MNWTRISAIAEILSSVAILVTLVYLSIQTRQNVDAIQANTRQAMLASDQQFLQGIVADPSLEYLYYKANLSDDEKIRFSALLASIVRMRENNWLQYQNGTLDERTWLAYRGSLVANLSAPNSRRWWQSWSTFGLFDSEFVSLTDELLVEAPLIERSMHIGTFE